MLKLILADNQAIFRAGIAKVLAVEDEMRIVAVSWAGFARTCANWRRNSAIPDSFTTTSPSGFCRSDAILARNLFGATPTDAVSRVVARIDVLILRAISTA